MTRRLALASLAFALLACGTPPPTTSGSDAGPGGELDAGSTLDDGGPPGALPDAGRLDAGLDAGTAPEEDGGGPMAVDCSALGGAFELCASSGSTCEAVYSDSEGCEAVCASAGLVCLGANEDVEDACAPDTSRPALPCDSGHQSDYCVCGRDPSCVGSCDGRVCGGDGCGGTCGGCDGGLSCVAGQCEDSPVDCGSYPYDPAALLAELEGFGRRAGGGDRQNVYHVTTTAGSGAGSLRAALESAEDYWIVFDVGVTSEARIDFGEERVRVRSNKTLDGRGRQVLLDGAIELRDGVRDVIFSDVRLTNSHGSRCTQEADVILIRGDGAETPGGFENRDLWFHHVELFEGGDGLLDVRGGSRITVSWSHLHSHSKGLLLSQASADVLEGREMEITFHHNFFDRLSRRGPRQTRGRVHYFNNYMFEWWEYGAAAVMGAQFRSENNVYQARPGQTCGTIFSPCTDPAPCGDDDHEVSKLAVSYDWASDERGLISSDGDVVLEDAVVQVNRASEVFVPDYSYTLEVAGAALAERVRQGAGPRATYCR